MDEIETIPPTPTPEITTTATIPEGKVYRDKVIYRATFFGGPLVAGYMMASNFTVFGENKKANWAWFWSILFTIVLFGTILLLPDNLQDKIPKKIVPLFYCAIVYYLAHRYQGAKITAHLNAGGQKYSGWRAFLVSVIGLVAFMGPLLYFTILTLPVDKYDSVKTYTIGNAKIDISYNSYNIPTSEVDGVAGVAIKTGYFSSKHPVSLAVKKDIAIYEITAVCSDVIKTDPNVLAAFIDWQKQLQYYITGYKIVLILCINDFDHVYKRIE